eukprot:TRINITY_DN3224_c0_g2_i1.p1 TRINITY_DN3224_c0_g2~~TRINITY_DN3224_c0_g2_i1.p1  ORF type:complete len:424 (-),score=53.03 TRINITY_DN3224_c0_g2_i1:227-1498(-)
MQHFDMESLGPEDIQGWASKFRPKFLEESTEWGVYQGKAGTVSHIGKQVRFHAWGTSKHENVNIHSVATDLVSQLHLFPTPSHLPRWPGNTVECLAIFAYGTMVTDEWEDVIDTLHPSQIHYYGRDLLLCFDSFVPLPGAAATIFDSASSHQRRLFFCLFAQLRLPLLPDVRHPAILRELHNAFVLRRMRTCDSWILSTSTLFAAWLPAGETMNDVSNCYFMMSTIFEQLDRMDLHAPLSLDVFTDGDNTTQNKEKGQKKKKKKQKKTPVEPTASRIEGNTDASVPYATDTLPEVEENVPCATDTDEPMQGDSLPECLLCDTASTEVKLVQAEAISAVQKAKRETKLAKQEAKIAADAAKAEVRRINEVARHLRGENAILREQLRAHKHLRQRILCTNTCRYFGIDWQTHQRTTRNQGVLHSE